MVWAMRAWRAASCATRRLRASTATKPPLSYSHACQFGASAARQKPRSIADLLEGVTAVDDVQVDGWVRSVRKQKRIAFAAIGDGSAVDSVQAVLKPEDAAELSHGTAVSLSGEWTPSQGGKQAFELQAKRVSVKGDNDAEGNPIQPKYQTAEFLRTIPHLRPRIPANALLLRLRSRVIGTLTRYFDDEGFVQTHTPVITSSDCEGAGEVFTVSSNSSRGSEQRSQSEGQAQVEHFFRTPKYLTVSAQLHLEALAQAVNKVWTLSPTFRAEKSDTARHLSEFYMLEAEQCFTNDLDDVMNVVEGMLRTVAMDLQQSKVGQELLQVKSSHQCPDEDESAAVSADELKWRWACMASKDWPRITYADAINELKAAGFDVSHEEGLETGHERWLAQHFGSGTPVFVTDYPAVQKPFYMIPSKSDADTVACFDLLVPDLAELVGGSLREHRSQQLLDAMESKGVAGKNLEWYQDLRKYGSVPHGGFGLGFDRLLCYLSGTGNIRDVVAFPRWFGRCEC